MRRRRLWMTLKLKFETMILSSFCMTKKNKFIMKNRFVLFNDQARLPQKGAKIDLFLNHF